MATPIIETIAAALRTALTAITVAGGYNYTVTEVVRPTRAGISPKNGTCVLEQGACRPAEEAAYTTDEWLIPYYITIYTRPSDTSTTALDTLGNLWVADVMKALGTNPQFAANVLDSWVVEMSFVESPDGAFDGIQVEYLLNPATKYRDLYTARTG